MRALVGAYSMRRIPRVPSFRNSSPSEQRKRSVTLSITHIFRSDREAQLDVRQSHQAPPDDGVSRLAVA